MATIQDLRPNTPRTNGTRFLKAIKHIARHHSGGTTGSWASFWPFWNKTKGWGTGGYHEIILLDGTVQLCYDPEEITNGVGGHNSTTYHICVVGNGSFTAVQEKVWEERCIFNMKRFGLSADKVLGHKEFNGAATACPGIDMGMVRNRLVFLQLNASKPVVKPVANPIEKGNDSVFTYLSRGDKGQKVKQLQANLIKVGLKLAVDGSYGPATENAVKAYQTANGLTPDGFYGFATKAKLEFAVKPAPNNNKQYRLMTGTFRTKEAAENAAAKLKKQFGWVVYVKDA
ncbi:peptidoglycan recognition protein family protein [Paenisporosarcina sp. TG-14]|uniref:peptidoglycan recognition protein family protein n=1 Tax=Paenisporosarcina sp. TG-14 TaxID=1231057 RepID=UPI00031A34D4|nr:N-acetylmuramoyl-L-alanine amidase [Paenisporosarcina sp. TG-14]